MIQLMQHQSVGLDDMRTNPRWAFWYDPGTGKSAMTLARCNEDRVKTLVVCPKSIMHTAWFDDAAKFFPSLKVVVCWASSPRKRLDLIFSGADVLVTNYETFRKHVNDFIVAGVKRLVIDESSKIRNRDSQISKAAFEASQRVEQCYLLSGTPAPNDGTEYFAQMRCVDVRCFGSNFWRFANGYFFPQKRTINGRECVIGFKPIPQRQPEFLEKLGRYSRTCRAVDCLDLPGETDEIREIDLSQPEWDCYADLLAALRHQFDDGQITQASANNRTMKLRQVTGGALYMEERRSKIIGKSKLDAVDELIDEIGDRQAVIWCAFTSEIDRLMDHLGDNYNVGRIDGNVPGDERTTVIRDFQAGKLRYVVCHPAAAAHGITLTAARFSIFYSVDFSAENHEQARRRIYRTGQNWPCVHYYLVARQTIDEHVLKVLRGKMNTADAIKAILATGETVAA